MSRPRGKPRLPVEVHAAMARAYAASICAAHAGVQRKLREDRKLSLYELERRSTLARQSLSDAEAGDHNARLYALAAVAFVVAGSLTEFVRWLEPSAPKRR